MALSTVNIELSLEPLIDAGGVNTEAPLPSVLLVTIYSNITMLLSVNDLPNIPSPK